MLEKLRRRLGLKKGNGRAASSAADRVASAHWYQAFEIAPGLITPGSVSFDAAGLLDSVGIEKDLTGKRAIDIGAWDGPMAFELERRGANVVALDVLDANETSFNLAKEILRSRVEHIRGSVYDFSQRFEEKFDIVCFLGVYYHLKNPIEAFEEIAKALADNGQVFFEGECLRHYAEDLDGNAIRDPLISQIAESRIPLALCSSGEYKNSPNWIIPNFACVLSWLKIAQLDLLKHSFDEIPNAQPPHQRIKALAMKRAPSVAITAVRQVHRTMVVSGRCFSEHTVVNLFRDRRGELVKFAGGITPDGTVKLPITLASSNEFYFELPPDFESGILTIEVCNPPYAGHEKVIRRLDVKREM